MILSVDPSLPLPVYEQVREQIQRLVLSGTITAGTRLPTIRQLSSDLGLAKGTIERAYELLAAEQVIERRGRNGTVVAQQPSVNADVRDAELADAAHRLVVVAQQVGADESVAVDALRRAWAEL